MEEIKYLCQYVIYDNSLKVSYDDVDVAVEVSNLFLSEELCEKEARGCCEEFNNSVADNDRYCYQIFYVEVVDGKIYKSPDTE